MNSTPLNSRPRVLLADDHLLVAEACKRLIEAEFEVVGIAKDGRELLRAAAQLHPDVIVSDISMPLLNGLDAGERIQQVSPQTRIIYLTMNTDPDLAARALRAGATGYVLKISAASELVVALRQALLGKRYVSPQLTRYSISSFLSRHRQAPEERTLTPRQREVVQLLAEGLSMKEVAAVLNVATRTVAFHKYRIMDLLGLKTNAELVQYAIRNGIVQA